MKITLAATVTEHPLLADEPLITTGHAPDGVEAAPDIAAIAWWWKHLPARTVA